MTSPSSPAKPVVKYAVVLAVGAAALAGAMVAFQGRFNGELAKAGTGTLTAGWLSYVGTLAVTLLIIVLRGGAPRAAKTLRHQGRWWWYMVGLCGIPIVLATTAGIPLVGVAVASVASVAGQTVAGLGLDSRGIGLPASLPFTARRVFAALVALGALVLAVTAASNRNENGVKAVLFVGLMLFVAGAILAVQQAGTGYIVGTTFDPVLATFTTALGGTVGISVIVAGSWGMGGLEGIHFPSLSQWWLYLGGPLGALITIAVAWAVRHLGTFVLTLGIVGGQMLAALLIDAVTGGGVQWTTVVAAIAIPAATLLAMERSPAT